jgi:hypothetical protein
MAMDVVGKTLPLNKDDFSLNDWGTLAGSAGEAVVELLDVANALEKGDVDWLKGNAGLATYYRTLAQNLTAMQQTVFGYNVTGNPSVKFVGESDA